MSPARIPTAPALPRLKASRVTAAAPWRPRRVFVVALLLSVGVHSVATLWPALPADTPDAIPLQATLRELPPPPQPKVVTASPAKSKARAARPRRPAAPFAPSLPGLLPDTIAGGSDAAGGEPLLAPSPILPVAPTAPVLADASLLAPPSLEIVGKTLPPRVDLVYRVFWGTQGFFIGDATYRFEHSGERYRIATVGEARGLAALILRGQGKLESEGVITPDGLQPQEFALVRGKGRKRESAHFDWNAGIVSLEDDKTAVLDAPTFDPLAFLWQFYFLPPTTDQQTFAIATTKRLYRYTFTREGVETIALPSGPVETERWHRRSDDGKTDAFVWLAPTMHYVAVKLRFSNTDRGTLEALLDAIRVDPDAMAQR